MSDSDKNKDGDEAKIKEEFNKLFGSKKKSVATGGGVFGKSLSQGMFSANKDEAAPSRNEKKVSMKVPEVGVVRAFSAMSGGLVGAIATAEEEAQRKAILERRLSKISSKSEEEKYPSKRVLLEDPKSGVAQYTRGFTHSLSHEEMGSGAGLKRNLSHEADLTDMAEKRHNEEFFPHYHNVMSRHRHRIHHQSQEKDEQRSGQKFPRKVSEAATVLPTIHDDDAHHHDEEVRISIAEESSDHEAGTSAPKEKLFKVGLIHTSDDEPEVEGFNWLKEEKKHKRRKKHRHRRNSHFTEEELQMRRAKGSELGLDRAATFELFHSGEEEELENRDIEDLSHHRYDHVPSYSRHMISSRTASTVNIGSKAGGDKNKKIITAMYDEEDEDKIQKYDHTPHDLFVQMDELKGEEWIEQSRWIKYEETREEGAERWGKPHVSALSFHSLLNLRLHLESGVCILDLEARDMIHVFYSVVEELNDIGLLEDELKGEVLRILLYRHRYVGAGASFGSGLASGLRKSRASFASFASIVSDDSQKRASSANEMKGRDNLALEMEEGLGGGGGLGHHSGPMSMPSLMRQNSGSFTTSNTFADLYKMAHSAKKSTIMHRIPEGSEGALTLCGAIEALSKPIVAFVRLSEGVVMSNALEVPLPLRFVMVVLTPTPSKNIDCHEVGRSFSTLMSNQRFHNVCYGVDDRDDLLNAINDFLDESVVLPPGDFDRKNLLSISEIQDMRRRKKERLAAIQEDGKPEETKEKAVAEKAKKAKPVDDKPKDPNDPMVRSPHFFGGMINDIKRRAPWFLSDFVDGLNAQCLAAAIFIYFAALSGAIAFGGLLGEKSKGLIGIPETLIVSCVAGCIFHMFSGMPLIITGVTGPVLLFDEALFTFSEGNEALDILPWRLWIGVWTFIISLIVAFFQGSILVKHFTKFTKDIFASLVSLLFIFEAIRKLVKIFIKHPLQSVEAHCNATLDSVLLQQIGSNRSFLEEQSLRDGRQEDYFDITTTEQPEIVQFSSQQEPNTALLSAFLMFGTFGIAYYLRIFKNGKVLGRTARRALGDFGVPLAIVIMVAIDLLFSDTYTEKLNVPDGLQVTRPDARGWLINPLGRNGIEIWLPFVSAIPALLLYLLLFMETHICELLMMEKTTKKGAGLHWDIVLLCFINCLSGIFGGPWICAATVRACAHISALTVMSTTHAPGEQPYIVEVKDQRLSALIVSVLLGFSVLLSPLLKYVPFAVLFGVFLYMGVSSINGIQFFDRLSLMFVPVKHHPHVSYVRRVRTWKMHLYTTLQLIGLAVLWAVKSSVIALAFPFFVVAMIPYRMALKYIFTERELEALDGKKAGQVIKDDEDDEPDFYAQGIGG